MSRELRRARAQAVRGDGAWRSRLAGYERGDTLIIALTAHAIIDDDDRGAHPPVPYCHQAVWIDRASTPQALCDRLSALALRAFSTVAAGLRDRGITFNAPPEQLTVELAVAPTVSARLSTPPRNHNDPRVRRDPI